jgi:hypothetical protein
MNKFYKTLIFLAVIVLFTATYGVLVSQAERSAVSYQAVLGKPLNNKEVANFIATNNCSSAGPFQMCKDIGMSLWLDSDQIVKSVYLYPTSTDGFAAYKGALPLGLVAKDTMASVEHKLGQPKVENVPQAGWEPGLPDEGTAFDHSHYWAIYKRFGVTVVYNSPSATDKNATIKAISVNK